MTDYTKITDFAAKDALAHLDPNKVTKGTEVDNELNAIAVAVATKTDTLTAGTDAIAEGHAATSKATPVDADEIPVADSASSYTLKKLTWANIKATLKTYFDTLYAALAGSATQDFAAKKLTLGAGALIESEGAAVTAASSTNIWAGDGNTVHVTGNTGIADFATAPQAGAWMKVIFDGTPLLTQSANLNLNAGGANIQIAAGDFALVYADTTTQMDVFVIKKDGTAVFSPIVQVVEATPVTSLLTGSPVILFDSSIPQYSEGDLLISCSITPKSASNRLRIEFDASMISVAGLGSYTTIPLFKNAGADAIAAWQSYIPQNFTMHATLRHEMAAGSTSAITFAIKIGVSNGTYYVNQVPAGQTLGGISAVRMRVIEIAG